MPLSSLSNQDCQTFVMSSSVCGTCEFGFGFGFFVCFCEHRLSCVSLLNYYQFDYSLQCLLFVSWCLVTNLYLGEAARSMLPIQLPQGRGCWVTRVPWGTCSAVGFGGGPIPPPQATQESRCGRTLPCAAGKCQSRIAMCKSREEIWKEL